MKKVIASGSEVFGIVGFMYLGLTLYRFSNGTGPGLYKLDNFGFMIEGVVFEEYLLFSLKELCIDGNFLEIRFSLGVHGNDYLYFIYYDKKFKTKFVFSFV